MHGRRRRQPPQSDNRAPAPSGPENRAGNRGGQLPTCRRAAVRAVGPRPQPRDSAGSSRAHLPVESCGAIRRYLGEAEARGWAASIGSFDSAKREKWKWGQKSKLTDLNRILSARVRKRSVGRILQRADDPSYGWLGNFKTGLFYGPYYPAVSGKPPMKWSPHCLLSLSEFDSVFFSDAAPLASLPVGWAYFAMSRWSVLDE
jgi:hypothetical protein